MNKNYIRRNPEIPKEFELKESKEESIFSKYKPIEQSITLKEDIDNLI